MKPTSSSARKRGFSLFFGTAKKLQAYQVSPFIEYRQSNPESKQMLLVPEIDYKLKCYSPKRLNIVINWLSLHSALKNDRDYFIKSYDQLVEAIYNPLSQ